MFQLLSRAPLAAALVFPLALAAPALAAAEAPAPTVAVSGAWVREAPPGASVLGGYATLTNTGKRPLVLSGAQSPLFGEVQMHTIVLEDGRERMKQLRAIPLPAGAHFQFVPGGNHLMLMRPKKALKQGDVVPVTLDFGPDGKLTVQMPIKRP